MLELQHSGLVFTFPDVHEEAKFSLDFQRTLRIPDDDKEYPLPPGLGRFPVRLVDDFKDRVPAKWKERGGVMFPMFQSEAMWLNFGSASPRQKDYYRNGAYPFAIKIGTGKVSAVTGDRWAPGLKEKDYLVVPHQRWLDGYVVEKGLVRQFVAAPLGWGFTAEEQLTGEAAFGGIQIEVIPMKAEVYERRFPKKAHRLEKTSGILRVQGWEGAAALDCVAAAAAPSADMGLAPGGKMLQQVCEDPYDFSDWDVSKRQRVFVHLANSLAWRAITQEDPPHVPPSAKDYTNSGFPWFEHYKDDAKTLAGSGKLAAMKSVLAMGFQKGFGILPENEAFQVKDEQTKQIADKPRSPHEVREGIW